jgi:nucleoside-diphosphate-sugar epimerase
MPNCALRPRILITGGAGFICSHLYKRLLATGRDVLCVDNFYTSTRDNVCNLVMNRGTARVRSAVLWRLILPEAHPATTTVAAL